MTDADKLAFRRFNQSVIDHPRPLDAQPCVREGVFLWCDDWEIIELNKYFFNGREAYFGDPPPNRLKHNPLWSKEEIASKAEALLTEHGEPERIIDALRQRRNGHG